MNVFCGQFRWVGNEPAHRGTMGRHNRLQLGDETPHIGPFDVTKQTERVVSRIVDERCSGVPGDVEHQQIDLVASSR